MIFTRCKPCKSRLFSPLSRNKGASFSHALRCLSVRDTLPAVRAVFDAVWLWNKGRTAYGTTLFILGLKKLGIQELIKGKYGNPKPFAKQRIRDKLRAYALVPVVKQDTMSVIVSYLICSNGNKRIFHAVSDWWSIQYLCYDIWRILFADTCGRVYRDNVLCCVDYAGDS